MVFEISLCKFHKNSLSERVFERKAITLCDELTEHKVFSQKVLSSFERKIFPFLPKPSLGFQISLYKLHKNSVSELLLEGKAVTL